MVVGDSGALLFDYAPWEQISAQRRGLMWALQLAHFLDRTLIVPPTRFHLTSNDDGLFEYRPFSALLELDSLKRLHPVMELEEWAAQGGMADVVFTLIAAEKPPEIRLGVGESAFRSEWCKSHVSMVGPVRSSLNTRGEDTCGTPADFAGIPGGVVVRNHT